MTSDRLLRFYTALYAVLFAFIPVLSNKIAHLGSVRFLAGTIAMGFAFMLVDVVNNRWGKEAAADLSLIGVLIRALLFLVVIPGTLMLPDFRTPTGYESLMRDSFRVFLAGEASVFLVQRFLQVPLFAHLKQKFGRIRFVGRYTVTSLVTDIVGVTLFTAFALWGVTSLPGVIWGQVIFRVALSLCLIPVATVLNHVNEKVN